MITALNGIWDRIAAAISVQINLFRQFSERFIDAVDGSRLTPLLLIITLLALIATAAAYWKGKDWFWVSATAGLLTWQSVIVSHWEQMKYATVATVFLAIAIVMSFAAIRFRRVAQDQAQALFAQASREKRITAERITHLPQIVQRWMQRADVVGKPTANKLVIKQRGTLRTRSDSKWMPFESIQYFTIDPPGFVWMATINAGPFIKIGGRDSYRNGHGHMVIKPLYLFNAANDTGKEVDQGTLVRYLAEMAWFPQAAVSPYLRWQSINEQEAHVTMDYAGISASGVYFFNADGDVTGFEAKRYGEFGGIYRKEMWSVKTTSFAQIGGTRIGNKNQVTWKLREGDFHWLNIEVTDITAGK